MSMVLPPAPAPTPPIEPTNAELQIALAKIQNEKEWRDFWRWLILSVPALLTAAATLYFTIKNNSDISKADKKIDTAAEVSTNAAETAKTAVTEAKAVAHETKTAVEEVKSVTEELKAKTDGLKDIIKDGL